MPKLSARAADDKRSATVIFLNYVGVILPRFAIARRGMYKARTWVQLEFEGVEAKGQSFPYGFQRRFLETPELKESPLALHTIQPFNSTSLCYRKKITSEFCSLQIYRLIFEVDADPMCRRPRPEKTETAGGKAKPEIW